eukprot:5721641-Pleurochrysis_carterae.AAC.1
MEKLTRGSELAAKIISADAVTLGASTFGGEGRSGIWSEFDREHAPCAAALLRQARHTKIAAM